MAPPRPASGYSLPAFMLEGVDVFAAMAPEARRRAVSFARVEALDAGSELAAFGAVLLIGGMASVHAAILGAPVAPLLAGKLLTARGTFGHAVGLRLVAGPGGARIAVWDAAVLEEVFRSIPTVNAELLARADRLQALAGGALGPLGELDEVTRDKVLMRLTVRVARAGDWIVESGSGLNQVMVVCVGTIALSNGVSVYPGELLFPRAVWLGAAAPASARASAPGALLLVGDSMLADELAAMPELTKVFMD